MPHGGVSPASRLEKVATVVVTACVVAVSAAVIYRLLVAPEPGPVSRSLARGDWSELVVCGTHYGPKDTPVRVVVFVDYECPFCRGFHEALENVMREPGAQFSVSVHDLPLRMHASAVRSAAIEYCTRHVLPYAEVATTLHGWQDSANHSQSFESLLVSVAQDERDGIIGCVADRQAGGFADSARAVAAKRKVTSTPTVEIDRGVYRTPPTETELRGLLLR
jgi:protein-disulfide isomerase